MRLLVLRGGKGVSFPVVVGWVVGHLITSEVEKIVFGWLRQKEEKRGSIEGLEGTW